ncbi:MAG: DUF1638 domain-containing protein [Methanimicrococcus sp.]|nr:DUF1638 domain-containing protein [Methanimicrococcus sp.]
MKTIAIVSCRIFEDELTFLMKKESGKNKILLIETEFTETIETKFASEGIEYTKIKEDGVKEAIEKESAGETDLIVLQLIEFSMEARPAVIKDVVYDKIRDFQEERIDGVMVFYGLCGNVLGSIEDDLKKPECPVRILKDEDGEIADDCICVALGSRKRYANILKSTARGEGTYFLTPMQAAYWRQIAYASALTPDPDNDEMIKMVFEYSNYKSVGKVSGLTYEKGFDGIVDDFAKRFCLNITDYEGTTSVIEKSYENFIKEVQKKDSD